MPDFTSLVGRRRRKSSRNDVGQDNEEKKRKKKDKVQGPTFRTILTRVRKQRCQDYQRQRLAFSCIVTNDQQQSHHFGSPVRSGGSTVTISDYGG